MYYNIFYKKLLHIKMYKLKLLKKCRVCLKKKMFCKPLFENVLGKYIPFIIEFICGVLLSQQDEPDAVVCIECTMALIQAENIKQKFLSSQEILLKEIENSKEQNAKELDIGEFIEWVGNNDKVNICNEAADELQLEKQFRAAKKKTVKKRKPFNRPTPYHFWCDICSFESDYAKNFRLHMVEVHKVENPHIFKCPQCSGTYTSYCSLQDHLGRIHDAAPQRLKYLCSECGERYAKRSLLLRHSYTHNPEKRPYKCGTCSRLFVTQTNMQRHMETHHSKVCPFTCEICEKTFATIYFLKTHQRRAHASM